MGGLVNSTWETGTRTLTGGTGADTWNNRGHQSDPSILAQQFTLRTDVVRSGDYSLFIWLKNDPDWRYEAPGSGKFNWRAELYQPSQLKIQLDTTYWQRWSIYIPDTPDMRTYAARTLANNHIFQWQSPGIPSGCNLVSNRYELQFGTLPKRNSTQTVKFGGWMDFVCQFRCSKSSSTPDAFCKIWIIDPLTGIAVLEYDESRSTNLDSSSTGMNTKFGIYTSTDKGMDGIVDGLGFYFDEFIWFDEDEDFDSVQIGAPSTPPTPPTTPLGLFSVGETVQATGSVFVPVPADLDVGKLMLLQRVCRHDGATTTPAGWDLVGERVSGGNDVNSIKHVVYSRIASAADIPSDPDEAVDTGVTLNDTGNFQIACITSWGRVIGPGAITDVVIDNETSVSVHSFPSATTTDNNQIVANFVGLGVDDSSPSDWANADIELEIPYTEDTSLGGTGGIALSYGVKATPGAVANTTFNTSRNINRPTISVAIQPGALEANGGTMDAGQILTQPALVQGGVIAGDESHSGQSITEPVLASTLPVPSSDKGLTIGSTDGVGTKALYLSAELH